MKISYNWIKDFIETNKSAVEVGDLLTGCGLEVENIFTFHSIPGGLEGIIVGHVLSAEKHPNADKLSICRVDLGNENIKQIVCGAPNVAANQKVLVAMVGSTVHPTNGEPFTINKAKIRGEVSEGMICAEDELSLGVSHAGILVLPEHYEAGKAAKEYFEIYSDQVFEIGLTANRGDAASHLGVARDLRALGLQMKAFASTPARTSKAHVLMQHSLDPINHSLIKVTIQDTDGCKRYSGLNIHGITVKPSPFWLQNRLKSIGLSPINNIVDATNFILHALGQPLHAFDADKIAGGHIIVKKAKAGSTFITLDKVERKLTGMECMIYDVEKPLALAGVFGGLDSGINEQTKNIFIESAYFNPGSIRKAAKLHVLNTDASFRFERGTDPNMTLNALHQAASLIMEIAGGNIVSEIIDIYPEPIADRTIIFSPHKSNELIGKEISDEVMQRILTSLEIETTQKDASQWHLSVPPYRVDVERPIDITEEILRIYGLNNIEMDEHINSAMSYSEDVFGLKLINRLADYLSANGFFEIATNSLTTPAYYPAEQLNNAVKLLNPLSNDLAVMRMDMLYSLLESVQYNNNRKNNDLRFYEFGKTYELNGKEQLLNSYHEQKHLAIALLGRKAPESWNITRQEYNYFGIKNILEQVLKQCGFTAINYTFETDERYEYATQLIVKKKVIGVFGQIKKTVAAQFDIDKPLWYADLSVGALTELAKEVKFKLKLVPVFPSVRRDLALLLSKEITYQQLEKIAVKSEPRLIKQINAFDVYDGDKIEEGKKSYALSFLLQDDTKTLTDEEIDGVMRKLISNFEKEAGAMLRG
ncbi:MAG: phenylalanine--tRNA ligase subunit beta [Bacteroidia bacterium]|nr:phenylalanine--tRNA ligase subunit beta [Bacteroidia bacterium]